MQAVRDGIASRFIQRGSGCSSQRALQCARPSSSKRPVRKPATRVYSIAQTSTSKVAAQYQRFSRSWVAPLVLTALVTATVVGIAASVIFVIKSNTVWATVKAAVVDQSKDSILTVTLVYGAMAAVISPCVYYLTDTAYKLHQRSSLLNNKTLQDWARAEGLEHLFTQEVIERFNSLGFKSAKELAAVAADDHNFLVRVWTVRGSGESNDVIVESQARAMNQYLVAYHERVIRAMTS